MDKIDLRTVDCNRCKSINITEENQIKAGLDEYPYHICTLFKKRVLHNCTKPFQEHFRISPCKLCNGKYFKEVRTMQNVVFLDFDGVVNSLIWKDGDFKYNFPRDDSVNNYQACQWVSKFCKDNGYSIVVSSTWRTEGLENCERYLRNGGIWSEIPIIGVTPRIMGGIRGNEIADYLMKHEVGQFLIFDDDSDMGSLSDRLVKCNTYVGFTFNEYQLATVLHGVFQQNKI